MEELIKRAKDVFEKIPYLTLATVSGDGNPNNSPVYGVHDSEYNFFWNSSSQSIHSLNIKENGKVSVVIYDSSVSVGEGFGVYFEGQAKELPPGDELQQALNVFYEKKGKEPKSQEFFLAPNSQRFYRLKPKKIWVNQYDKTKTPPDYKVEIKLL